MGRQQDPVLRKEAEDMCRMMASSTYVVQDHEDLNNIKDLRIHATMYPNNASNLYRACIAGIRR